ncbi:MAG: hypothetical protein CSB16_01110 [Clostridiales bacterium]|nr:MAG: hypothetical protein CSB16_01110 [Clostridiales bacterium]
MIGFKDTYEFYKRAIRKTFIIVLFAFAFVIIASTIFFIIAPNYSQELIQYFLQNAKIFDSQGNISVIKLILNNIKASLVAVLLGIIPFLCLSSLSIIANAVIVGAVLALQGSFERGLLVFILGILPHGVFELTAFMISISIGIRISLLLGDKIRGKDVQLKEMLLGYTNVFVLFVVPLLIFSGFIEVYITPILMRLL